MSTYRDSPTRADRAKAIIAVVGVHAAIGALILGGRPDLPEVAEAVRTTLIDIAEPPPPPPPPPPDPGRAPDEEGAAGRTAEPTPVVAPEPRIELPARRPIPAAPVAGTGSAASAGAASAGTGPGAGGAGSGRGGGGSGGGGGIGSEARLLSGGLTRTDYRRLRAFAAPSGRARMAIMVGTSGRVTGCQIANSSGDPALDSALCAILGPRMQWAPARDTRGTPIEVRVYYVATWDRG